MKGISAVVATILMLMITIALAGTAYMFVSGVFSSRTANVLDFQDSTCAGATITTTVKNDGTTATGVVTVTATNPSGATFAGNTCTIASINPGTTGNCAITRPAGQGAGTYSLTVTSGAATPAKGYSSCISAT